MDAELRLDHSLVAIESGGTVFGLLELKAPEAATDANRPSLGIALVIDRSGSMSGEKLETAKACGAYLASRLASVDRMSVVAYDDEVTLVSSLEGPGPRLGAAIGGIYSGGSTNLSGGWLKGVELLEHHRAEVRRVLLLTDGLANVGITNHSQLTGMASSAAARGITTTTIGLGADHDETLLAAMSDAGQGHDHFAATPDEAPEIFAKEFDSLAAMVAQNLSVEIRPLSPTAAVGILNEYPITQIDDGLQASLGDTFGGQPRRLVFRLAVPAMADLGPAQVAEVVVRWVDVTGESVQMHTRTIPVMVNLVPGAEASQETADPGVVDEVVILDAARARKEARELAERGEHDQARQLLDEQALKLRSISSDSAKFQEAVDDLEQLERFSQRLEMRTYDSIDAKMMWDQSRRRHRSEEYRKRPDRT